MAPAARAGRTRSSQAPRGGPARGVGPSPHVKAAGRAAAVLPVNLKGTFLAYGLAHHSKLVSHSDLWWQRQQWLLRRQPRTQWRFPATVTRSRKVLHRRNARNQVPYLSACLFKFLFLLIGTGDASACGPTQVLEIMHPPVEGRRLRQKEEKANANQATGAQPPSLKLSSDSFIFGSCLPLPTAPSQTSLSSAMSAQPCLFQTQKRSYRRP